MLRMIAQKQFFLRRPQNTFGQPGFSMILKIQEVGILGGKGFFEQVATLSGGKVLAWYMSEKPTVQDFD
jgi:hypothetical protein